MSLQRYSSRTADLHGDFLAEALKGARRYLRIAGYFRSSVFEVAGEALEAVPEVKILCNSDLDAADLMAAGGEAELKARWNEEDPGMASLLRREQYRRLARMLEQGNLEIRLVPGEKMFLHGKAGCISYSPESGRPRRAFVGSVNESLNGWKRNYELLWSDDGEESAVWVEREFLPCGTRPCLCRRRSGRRCSVWRGGRKFPWRRQDGRRSPCRGPPWRRRRSTAAANSSSPGKGHSWSVFAGPPQVRQGPPAAGG